MGSGTKKTNCKGMVAHKKVQKQKVVAKRAAAEKAKQGKAIKAEKKVETVQEQGPVIEKRGQHAASLEIDAVATQSPTEIMALLTRTVDARDDSYAVQGPVSVVGLIENHGTLTAESTKDTTMVSHCASVQDEYINEDTLVAKQNTSQPSVTVANTCTPQNLLCNEDCESVNPTTPSVILDIKAYRNSLERASYDNMESSMEGVSRFAHTKSACTEPNHEHLVDYLKPEARFKVESITNVCAKDDKTLDLIAGHAETPVHATFTRSLLVDDLFHMVHKAHYPIFGCRSNATVSHTLEDVELRQRFLRSHAKSTYKQKNREPSSAAAEDEISVELPAVFGDRDTSRTCEAMFMKVGMASGYEDQLDMSQTGLDPEIIRCKIALSLRTIDPAILSCKVKKYHGTPHASAPVEEMALHQPLATAPWQAGAEKIKFLIGADRLRNKLTNSTVYSRPTSAPFDSRPSTLVTYYTVTPSPAYWRTYKPQYCSFLQYNGYQNCCCFNGGFDPCQPSHSCAKPLVPSCPQQPDFRDSSTGQTFYQYAPHY